MALSIDQLARSACDLAVSSKIPVTLTCVRVSSTSMPAICAAHAEGTAHGEAVLLGELPAHEHAVVGALRDGSPSTSRRCPLAK